MAVTTSPDLNDLARSFVERATACAVAGPAAPHDVVLALPTGGLVTGRPVYQDFWLSQPTLVS